MSTLMFIVKTGFLGIVATICCILMGLGLAYCMDILEERRKHR